MKILFFIDILGPGGKERRVVELLKGLSKNPEIKIEIVVMDKNIHFSSVFDLNINIHDLIRKSKKDFSVLYKLYKICKTFRPDFIHCWDSMTSVHAVLVYKLLIIKPINSMITNAPLNFKYKKKDWIRAKLTFPFSILIISNSQARLVSYKAPPQKSIFIHNGFDTKRLLDLDSKADITKRDNINTPYIVVMVAMFESRKDYETYIYSAQNIQQKRDDTTFIAIGDGSTFDNKITNVKLLGKQSNVESIINACDIGILCTNNDIHGEGISNSIMEYMAMGKPDIATKRGGTAEIIENNITGYIIPPKNPEVLSNIIFN